MKDRSKKLLVINTGKKGDQEGVYSASAKPSVAGGSGMASPGNLSDYLLKSIWDRVWEIKTDSKGNEYIFGKLPVVTQYGITMYADGGELNLPSIYAGIPFDNKTIWLNPETKKVEVIGGTGGGVADSVHWNNIEGKPLFSAVATSGKYADLSGLPDLSVYATTEYLTTELKKYVTLNTEQTIGAHKDFLNGLSIGGLGITKSQDDVIYLDANLVVRGGITMYSDNTVDVGTIFDALPIDGNTIYWENGVLKANVTEGVITNITSDMVVEALGFTPYNASNPKGYISGITSAMVVSALGYTPLQNHQTIYALTIQKNGTNVGTYTPNSAKKTINIVVPTKVSELDNDEEYATTSDLDSRIDALINGAPTAFDTLKEIADVLQGNVNSIGDIITTLSTKADKAIKISAGTGLSGGGTLEADRTLSLATSGVTAGTYKSVDVDKYGRVTSGTNPTTLAGYGITDAYTKTKVDELLGNYVTLATKQTITGEKNFTGGLKVNGSPIVYDATNKYWKLEGDLLVTGGVTMYATDAIDVPSIIDALPIASASAKGIAAFNPNDFSVVDGYVSFIGKGGVDESVLADYAKKTDLSKYLPLSGGELSNTGYVFTINRLENDPAWLQFKSNWEVQGSIGAYNNSLLWLDKNYNSHTILHSGNWSQYVTAGDGGNYLPLSGGTLNGTLSIGTAVPSAVGRATLGLVSVGDNPVDFKMGNGSQVWSITARNNENRKNMWFYSYVSSNILIELDATHNAVRIGRGTDNLADYLDPEYSLDVVGPLRSNRGVFKSSSANILSLYRMESGGGAWIDYYAYNQTSSKWRVGAGGIYDFTWEAPDGNYPCRIHYNKSDGIRFEIGKDFTTTGTITDPSRATLTLISTSDNPTDLIMGANNYDWSITARGSSDDYFLGFYSNRNSQYVTRMYRNGNVLVTGGITMYSDIRKKTKLQDVELSLKQIADAPLIEHYYNSDTNKTTHVGSIAQYWASMNDWFCKLDNNGYYTMEIQNAALASAISIARELVKYESKTDKAIKKLKKRICELEEEVERLKAN